MVALLVFSSWMNLFAAGIVYWALLRRPAPAPPAEEPDGWVWFDVVHDNPASAPDAPPGFEWTGPWAPIGYTPESIVEIDGVPTRTKGRYVYARAVRKVRGKVT